MQIQESAKDGKGLRFTINKMAHIYLQMENYEAAMRHFRVYFEKLGNTKPVNLPADDKSLYARTQVTFGKYLESFGDKGEPDNYRISLEYFLDGLDLFLSMNNKKEASQIFYEVAGIHYKLGDLKNTITNCENAIVLAEALPDHEILMNSYDLLSRAWEGLEKFRQANQASRQMIVFRDSVYMTRTARQIRQIKVQSDYNSNESYIHRIEQMIAQEEMNNLAITRLELQADKNLQEIELLAKEKSLQEYTLKNEQLEKEKALQELQLISQKYEAEKKDRKSNWAFWNCRKPMHSVIS
jgi:tetratricopeptide (TPR) repeat protein